MDGNRCFKAVRKELSPEGESIKRLESDIAEGKWEDVLLYTREYDAGFRNGVLKSIWKQLPDEIRGKTIAITNSFTYDLIGVNKAARKQDATTAKEMLELVKKDLRDVLAIESSIPTSESAMP
jgi:hypothetical protein